MVETFKVGDAVEIIAANVFKPMPGGLTIGSRGTVIGEAEEFFVRVDYGLPKPVLSMRDSIRKIPPSQDWTKLCNLTDVPQEALCD